MAGLDPAIHAFSRGPPAFHDVDARIKSGQSDFVLWDTTCRDASVAYGVPRRPRKPGDRGSRLMLFDRHEDRMADLAFDVLREMALAGRILDQDDLARADEPALAVAGGNFDPGVEIDDVLAARRGVPVDVVLGLGFAKDDA